MKKSHKFIHGRSFVLQTGHRPLLIVYGSKKGISVHTANRLQRWGTISLNYNAKMKFVPFKKLIYADVLSRLIRKLKTHHEVTVIAATKFEASRKISQVRLSEIKQPKPNTISIL